LGVDNAEGLNVKVDVGDMVFMVVGSVVGGLLDTCVGIIVGI